MNLYVLAEGGGVTVGEHPQWHVLGLTINADTVISTAIAAGIVLAFGLYLAAKATSKVPSALQLAFEAVTEQVENQVESNVGIRTAPFVVPLAIALFFFILIANWISILPHAAEEYVRPPTADVNLTFAMSIFVMILVWATGIRIKGKHYFGHFVEPYKAMLPLNIIEELVKPITLSLRLFGNILAGTVMVSVLALMPAAVSWLPTSAWKLFDLFIGLLQALIFALLTIIYFGMATSQEGEEAH
ncbi:MAG: F0F1 ATP synthase subunit A [Pseudonocardiales bacterium]|nr:F0F1 ATP synthase subunit A [Pseudonocardiales bacterium]MBV9727912.1 F0F1 ATP synthase subunit A [Pseudonocardiales bacterium]